DLPTLARPGLHAEIGSAIFCVKRLEIGPDQHIFVGAGCVSAPFELARIGVEPRQPAAHAKLAAAIADQHSVFGDDGSHGDGFALIDIAQLRAPDFLPSFRVYGNGLDIESVVNDFAVVKNGSPIYDIAACNTLGSR